MKVWLLNPPYKEKVIREGRCEQEIGLFQTTYPPLTLSQLASILKPKYEPVLIDAVAESITETYLINKINQEKPRHVFVNTSTPTFDNDLSITKTLLKNSPETKFYMFGVHAKYFSGRINLPKHIILLNKEPEKKAFELIGKKKVKFKEYPIPSWDLINLNNYKIPLKNKPFLIVQTSRGCPYSCTFCTAPFYYGKKYRMKTVNYTIKEIQNITKLGINEILFYSETFTLNKEYVKEICNIIIKNKLNINWMCNSRVDTVDYELLKLMKKSGCWLISYGIESASQDILNKSNKNYKLYQAKNAIKLTNKAGILSLGHFILGLPGETKESLQKTIKLSRKINLDFALYYVATPFPGSQLYEKNKDSVKNVSSLSYSKNNINNDLDLEKSLKNAYTKFYFNLNRLKTIYKLTKVTNITSLPSILQSGIKTAKILLK